MLQDLNMLSVVQEPKALKSSKDCKIVFALKSISSDFGLHSQLISLSLIAILQNLRTQVLQFTFEGNRYDLDELTKEAKVIYEKLVFTYQSIEQFNAQHAVMSRAKNAYIEDLKSEIVQKKSGVDLGSLLTED